MSSTFFDTLKNTAWTPPVFPALDDPQWEVQFSSASAQEKTNLANAWLWRFNQIANPELMATESKETFIASVIAQQYKWLRLALPYSTKELFKRDVFDGTVESLMLHTTRLTNERKPIIKKGIEDLWFGDNQTRVDAVKKLSSELSHLMNHHGDLPRLKSTLQNMAWEVVENNPEDRFLRACAARISVLHGMANNDMPNPWHPENTAWHGIAKLTNYRTTNVMYAVVDIMHATITNGDACVAAYNIPTVMDMLSLVKMQQSKENIGLTAVIDLPLDKVTHYDILRAWIPSKTHYWNSAEALELSLEDACKHVAADMFSEDISISLPNSNLDNSSI